MDFINVTGLAETQIKNSLVKAASAFEKDIDLLNINLITIDLQEKDDIDICDAIFGTEFDFFKEIAIDGAEKMTDFFKILIFKIG